MEYYIDNMDLMCVQVHLQARLTKRFKTKSDRLPHWAVRAGYRAQISGLLADLVTGNGLHFIVQYARRCGPRSRLHQSRVGRMRDPPPTTPLDKNLSLLHRRFLIRGNSGYTCFWSRVMGVRLFR